MTPTREAPPAPRLAAWLALALVAGFGGFSWLTRGAQVPPVFCPETASPAADTVIMLSASWCGYCRRAREFFVRERIDYCEYDIETSATGARRHAAIGARGVPVILVRGQAIVGFSPAAVLAARADAAPATARR